MKSFVKALVFGTMPAFLVGGAALPAPAAPPATQPAIQPTTQPAPANIADSNDPIVIPDGTSREHPGPASTPPIWGSDQGSSVFIYGIRQ